MANNSIRVIRRALPLAMGMAFLWAASVESVPAQQQNQFTASDAASLLERMNDALVNRQAARFLSAFDLTKMRNGPLFKQQITSFIAHSDSIRMHFNLTQVSMARTQGAAEVDAELEADMGNGGEPLYKQATLHFIAEKTGAAWKFVDVQPRSFFSSSRSAAASSSASSPAQQ